jgi:multiple sugar transport system substrate-binding protein
MSEFEEGSLRKPNSGALAVVATALCAALGGCGFSSEDVGGGGKRVTLYGANEVGFAEAIAACNKQANGRYTISYVVLPRTADAQRELMARRLAAEDSDIDLLSMDVPWTAEFAEAGWIREWKGERARTALAGRLEGPVRTVQYEDKVWATPFTTNTQMLFYRKDRVKTPPRTWDEMIDQAERLKTGIAVQAARYEGLTVWINSLVASAGGQIVGEDGEPTLDRSTVRAAEIINRLATSSAAPAGMSNLKEDTANFGFQDGSSSFQLNYSFIFPGAAEIKGLQDKIGWARWPRVDPNEPSHVTLGGFNLAVSKYSKNPELAFEAAECMASPERQEIITGLGGLAPTSEELYDSPKVKKTLPFAALMRETLDDGTPRAVSPAYSDISLAIQKTFHPPEGIDPRGIVDELEDKLDKAAEGKVF